MPIGIEDGGHQFHCLVSIFIVHYDSIVSRTPTTGVMNYDLLLVIVEYINYITDNKLLCQMAYFSYFASADVLYLYQICI